MATIDYRNSRRRLRERRGEDSGEIVGITGATMLGTMVVKPDNKDGTIWADSEPGN